MVLESESGYIVRPPADFTMKSIVQFANEVRSLFDNANDLNVELNEVTDIDSSGLQLLVSLKHEALLKGMQIRFLNPSPEVEAMLNVYNVKEFIQIQGTI